MIVAAGPCNYGGCLSRLLRDMSRCAQNYTQTFCLGHQKSGTSVMARALSTWKGFDSSTGGVYNGEAVLTCCGRSSNHSCVNHSRLSAPLFGGNMSRYFQLCSKPLGARVIKADDMLWDFDALYAHARATCGVSMRFVFFVRHPMFVVRSLISWWEQMRRMIKSRPPHPLAERIYSGHDGRTHLSPSWLAGRWRSAARVYLADPSRWATMMRYEDFLSDPLVAVRKAVADMMGPLAARMVVPARVRAVVKTKQCRITGDYDHKEGDASSLFDAATTVQILSVCAAEMRAFGYSTRGADYRI